MVQRRYIGKIAMKRNRRIVLADVSACGVACGRKRNKNISIFSTRRKENRSIVNTLNVICVHFYLLRLVKVKVFRIFEWKSFNQYIEFYFEFFAVLEFSFVLIKNRYFNLLFLSHRQCVNCMILNIFHINRLTDIFTFVINITKKEDFFYHSIKVLLSTWQSIDSQIPKS